jgi:hypothetical protein
MLQVNDTTRTVERTADTRGSRGDRFEARGFNKRCFVLRDTKQTEPKAEAIARRLRIAIEQLRDTNTGAARAERGETRRAEERAESSDELESTSLPAKPRAALLCLCLRLVSDRGVNN